MATEAIDSTNRNHVQLRWYSLTEIFFKGDTFGVLALKNFQIGLNRHCSFIPLFSSHESRHRCFYVLWTILPGYALSFYATNIKGCKRYAQFIEKMKSWHNSDHKNARTLKKWKHDIDGSYERGLKRTRGSYIQKICSNTKFAPELIRIHL